MVELFLLSRNIPISFFLKTVRYIILMVAPILRLAERTALTRNFVCSVVMDGGLMNNHLRKSKRMLSIH